MAKSRRSKSAEATVPDDWRELLTLLPGYDPFVGAGGYRFSVEHAMRAILFFETELEHVKGELAGEPFLLEPWEQAFIANLMGWVDARGLRRYRQAFVGIPRKNGKTTLAAGLANYALFCDGESGAEIIIAAAERDQARLLFDVAKHQVLRNPKLRTIAEPRRYAITIDETASSIIAVSADASTKHGTNPHVAIIDEVHAQRSPDLIDTLTSGQGARRQPLIVFISTSDYDRESVCNEKWDYARAVRDGLVSDPRYLVAIWETAVTDDWTDRDLWRAANPSLGVSISMEFLECEFHKAEASPRYQNTFRRLYLNQRTGQESVWIDMRQWDACAGAAADADLEGQPCFAGLDLSSTTDLSALALAFPFDDGSVELRVWFWAPETGAQKRGATDQVDYLQWASEGHLTLTPGEVIDYAWIRREIEQLCDLYDVREIAVDPYNATQLLTELDGAGYPVVKHLQSYQAMSPGATELERLMVAGKLRHGAHPVLRWMASHVAVDEDPYERIRPSKRRSTERIDGIVAASMAVGRVLEYNEETVYDQRGSFASL